MKILVIEDEIGLSDALCQTFKNQNYSAVACYDGQSYGLGLAIAKSVCDEHSGSISATSEHGQWAEFTVELPLK